MSVHHIYLDDLRNVVALELGLDAFLALLDKCVAAGANFEQILGAITAGYKLRECI